MAYLISVFSVYTKLETLSTKQAKRLENTVFLEDFIDKLEFN